MLTSEKVRNISPDPFCRGCADEAAKLERVARAANEVIAWMDESGPGVDELLAALADLPEDALK